MARTGSRVAVLPGIGLVVARPGGVGYEGAREVSNAMINRHPALIAQCRTREAVIAALGFARSRGLTSQCPAVGTALPDLVSVTAGS